MRLRRIGVIIVLVLSILAVLPIAGHGAKQASNIEMQVKAGYEGVARLGAYIPYNILLINKGRAVEGEVQLEIRISSDSKTIIAKPFSLPEGSTKEIVITAPVFTARRDVIARVRESGKTVKEMKYSFFKMIPPEMKAIGVLSSDNAAYGFLNGMMLPMQKGIAYEEKLKLMIASGAYPASSSPIAVPIDASDAMKTESVLIPLKRETMPDDLKVMNGFDILIIGNFDTGTLSSKQLDVLEKWVQNGGTLVLGMGANWKRTYDALPESLKKFTVAGVKSAVPPNGLDGLSKKGFTGNVNIESVFGDLGFEYVKAANKDQENTDGNNTESGSKNNDAPQIAYNLHQNEVIAGHKDMPLIIKYVHEQGRILFLTFDPAVEPVAGWEGKQEFWENLLFHSSVSENRYRQREQGYYYSTGNQGYYFESLAQQVPESKQPPFLFMLIVIVIYVIIVGPIMYIILKRKDKRDLNWLAVPAVALLCLFVIYIAGFRTRYQTAVLNAVSMINLDMERQKTDIQTGMGIFNNKKGDLKLAYSMDSNIEFDISGSNYRGYYSYPDGKEPEGKVVSKLLLTDPVGYELYDVAMWEPKYLSARRSEPLADQLINSLQIKDGRFKAVIRNSTQYEFMDAFMSVGSAFFSIGDVLPGQEITVDINLDSRDVHKSMESFLDAKFGRSSYPQGTKPPEDFAENMRKRNIVQNVLMNNYYGIRGQAKIGLYALNNQDMGFDVMINDKKPEVYYSNGIFTSMDMRFEKGKELEIPGGIVIPVLEQDLKGGSQTAYLDDINGVRVARKGDIDFTCNLLKGISYSGFSLKFDTYVPLYIKYNIEEMQKRDKNFQGKILTNVYEYYIYNKKEDKWEKIDATYTVDRNASDYIDGENRLKLRVKVVEMGETASKENYNYLEFERLALPEITLKGVAE